jgi:hypothetical protein
MGRELQVPWCPHHQSTVMIQTHQDSREDGTTMPIPPQESERIWHGSSDPQIYTAAPSRASWLFASPPGMATARPTTARYYRKETNVVSWTQRVNNFPKYVC